MAKFLGHFYFLNYVFGFLDEEESSHDYKYLTYIQMHITSIRAVGINMNKYINPLEMYLMKFAFIQ